jgi:hypothetical protein
MFANYLPVVFWMKIVFVYFNIFFLGYTVQKYEQGCFVLEFCKLHASCASKHFGGGSSL